jgi:ABC-2 type transport system ATP-binding protein
MGVIEAQGLCKSFGKVQALDGVDLCVEPGEVYGFIGPNGAGKSTTIRVLLGILKANAGTASIFGLDVWKDAVQVHKDIAYVPGDVNLWSNLSGGEVIDLFLRLRKGGRSGNAKFDPARRAKLCERFDFDPTKKCGTYSKGNRQKVALIAAFSVDADLYILDEPTSGLDPLMELVFRACVQEAKDRGASVLLSSHILSEVELLCDRISIIRTGRIIDSGTLDDMRHLTRNKVTLEAARPLSGLETLPGVHNVEHDDAERNDVASTSVTFSMDNSKTASLLAFLADKNVTHFTSTPPTLEELFMSHYTGGAPLDENAPLSGGAPLSKEVPLSDNASPSKEVLLDSSSPAKKPSSQDAATKSSASEGGL